MAGGKFRESLAGVSQLLDGDQAKKHLSLRWELVLGITVGVGPLGWVLRFSSIMPSWRLLNNEKEPRESCSPTSQLLTKEIDVAIIAG